MAQSYAFNQAANVAIDEITRWLSKAGNVKLSLNVDKKLSLKSSQFDWLIPWYEQADMLLFTQHSIHNTDGRLQSNNGIGLRQFNDRNTVGINAFFDHDLSHYHSRLGIGAEYWQDYLKLTANSYLPVSGWRSTSALSQAYNARPPAVGMYKQRGGYLLTLTSAVILNLNNISVRMLLLWGKINAKKTQQQPQLVSIGPQFP
ncbi:inverse autotransporter beta domain-containing protein [Providencia vermicola]|nr:inverse autotransporter beta domain-containing protein [Providencia vermicola]